MAEFLNPPALSSVVQKVSLVFGDNIIIIQAILQYTPLFRYGVLNTQLSALKIIMTSQMCPVTVLYARSYIATCS